MVESVENKSNWNECADYIAEAWNALIEALQSVSPEGAGTIAPELAKKALEFWIQKHIILTKFNLTETSEIQTPALIVANAEKKEPIAIVVTPKAMESKRELIDSLLHELIHAAGFLSDNAREDEELTEEVTNDLIEKVMKQKSIKSLPEPPECEAEETIETSGKDEELQKILENKINEAIIINADTLARHINNLRDPRKWFDGLTKKIIELDKVLDELLDLAKALKSVYDGRSIRDIDDPDLRDRFLTILAGGINPEKQDNNQALAPLLWKLFGIEIRSLLDNDTSKSNMDILVNYKINGVYIKISSGILESFVSKIKNATRAYLKAINGISLSGTVHVSRDPRSIIVKYIPAPGQDPVDLLNILRKLLELLYEIMPGINPYVTFALAMSPAYLIDLAKILNINLDKNISDNDFKKLKDIIRLLGYNRVITYCNIENRCPDTVENLISAIRSETSCPVFKYADGILLVHEVIYDYGDGVYYREVRPWPIAIVEAILSKEFENFERILQKSDSNLTPRRIAINYLLGRLENALYKLKTIKTKLNKSRNIVCFGTYDFVRSARHASSMCETHAILYEIPPTTLYSPGLVIYSSVSTVSVASAGEKRIAASLNRIHIPGEELIISEICRGENK